MLQAHRGLGQTDRHSPTLRNSPIQKEREQSSFEARKAEVPPPYGHPSPYGLRDIAWISDRNAASGMLLPYPKLCVHPGPAFSAREPAAASPGPVSPSLRCPALSALSQVISPAPELPQGPGSPDSLPHGLHALSVFVQSGPGPADLRAGAPASSEGRGSCTIRPSYGI